jgi:hypothetical protein
MLEDARKTRVFVPIICPLWSNSKYCQQEFDAFLESAEPESLFPAILRPVSSSSSALQNANQVAFYKSEPGVILLLKGPAREREIHRLAQAIAERLARPPARPAPDIFTATREHIAPVLLETCGWMRILNMTQRIDAGEIYTEVNIFERADIGSLAQIKANPGLVDQVLSTRKRTPAKEALTAHPRVMILGRPGAGKTTFLRRLAVECIRGAYCGDLVPAYLEFRALQGRSIAAALAEAWGVNPSLILSADRALLLLDGFDELPSRDFESIRKELDILLSHSKHPVLLTCRIAAREYTSRHLDQIEIADFTKEQQDHFARHWFPARGHGTKYESFLRNMSPGLRDLAKNPLLLTMMCLYYEEHADMNVSRADLYRKGLDTILDRWDASRGVQREDSPYGRLSPSDREWMYVTLAARHFENGEVAFSTPNLSEFFSENIDRNGILQVMEAQHGLLIQRTEGVYSFAHLTFQEYLTARHFAEESDPGVRERLLLRLPDPRWREIFLLVTSMTQSDYLLRKMQETLNQFVVENQAIQRMLDRLQRDTLPVRYLHLAIAACVRHRTRASAVELDRVFARTEDLDRDLDRNRGRDLASEIAHALELNLDLNHARDLARGVGHRLGGFSWDGLVTALDLVLSRKLGISLQLSLKDSEILTNYEAGYLVLLDCLKTARVTPALRKQIEDNAFRPLPKAQARTI